ncbi:MAG: hypothetical protein R2712_24565 [Vicinamibacterales bacterium]
MWRGLAATERAPWIAAALAAAAFATGARALQTQIPAGDEPHYLIIAQSLLLDGDLRIENNHARGDYYPYHASELRPDYLRRGTDGEIYSIHAPGVALLLAPAFAIAGYPGAVALQLLVAALGVAILWLAVHRLTGHPGAAWVASAAWALSAPAYFHAFTIFPDGPGAVATIAGLWLLVALEAGHRVTTGRLVAVGGALAALPWLHTRFALIAGILGLVLVVRLIARPDGWRAVRAFLALPVVSAAAWFAFFWVIWGTPNPSAPYGSYTQSAFANVGRGLAGLLLDQQFGLLANAPIFGVAIFGFASLARRSGRLAAELALLLVCYASAVGAYQMWWGGYSAPARFLVAALPAAVLPIGVCWARASVPVRSMILLLLAVSAAMVAARTFVDGGALLYNARDGADLLLDWASRSVNLPLAWPSLHRGLLAEAVTDSVLWASAAALFGVLAWWAASASAGGGWTAACAAAALTMMGASTVVWQRYDDHRVTPNTSELDLLHHWSPGWRTVGWQSSPMRLMDAAAIPARLELASTVRARPAEGPTPLFTAPLVPAGDYDVLFDGSARPTGHVDVVVGRTLQPIEGFELTGDGPYRLHLPVRAHSVSFLGDERARQSLRRIVLRPHAVGVVDDTAVRGSRYGQVRVFFLDDDTFMEPPGFWTRGDSDAVVVVDTASLSGGMDVAHPVLRVRSGAVPTTVELDGDGWSRTLSLDAGATAAVPLPDAGSAGTWRVHIRTRGGFRPVEHEPGSRDYRNLGVWVELGSEGPPP